jgi:phospholipase A2
MEYVRIHEGIVAMEDSVIKGLTDATRFPEVKRVAEVRRGLNLSSEEAAFLAERQVHVRNNFAKYMGIDPAEVHPDDVPTIGLGGSGGGLRAMITLLGYAEEMKHTGLWDLLTYTSGVSGSCWALGAYYTFGEASVGRVLDSCKRRFSPHHPLSVEAIRSVLSSPCGPYAILGPLVQKQKSGLKIELMDLLAVFSTGQIFFQEKLEGPAAVQSQITNIDDARFDYNWLKLTDCQKHLRGGAEPLPIFTAIRHERPWQDWVDPKHPFNNAFIRAEEKSGVVDAWFQWFEMTPFEIGCDEIEAWIPAWSFGRPFAHGKSVTQLPEQSLSLVLGLSASFIAVPLEAYISNIDGLIPQGLVGNIIREVVSEMGTLMGKQGVEDFENQDPLKACNEYNFMFHYSDVQPGEPYPPGLENAALLHLIDSGSDNNLPTYCLLHPSREIDVIIDVDASDDAQIRTAVDQRVHQVGDRRGLKFTRRDKSIIAGIDPNDRDRYKGMYAQIFDGTLEKRPATVVDYYGHTVTNPPAPTCHTECTLVFMPLLSNEAAVPGLDVSAKNFTHWTNDVWTPEQIDMLVKVCKANFHEGQPAIRTALSDAWMKKKTRREAHLRNNALDVHGTVS